MFNIWPLEHALFCTESEIPFFFFATYSKWQTSDMHKHLDFLLKPALCFICCLRLIYVMISIILPEIV